MSPKSKLASKKTYSASLFAKKQSLLKDKRLFAPQMSLKTNQSIKAKLIITPPRHQHHYDFYHHDK